jgi:hypothetical protein
MVPLMLCPKTFKDKIKNNRIEAYILKFMAVYLTYKCKLIAKN